MAELVGFVFQEPESQFVFDIVEDEIAFVLENFGVPFEKMHQRVDEMIQAFALEGLQKEKIGNLSGGEKQKVALASVMINRPKVLLLDEPTSQLDPRSAAEILDFVVELRSQHGLTVLISEHRLERLLPYIDHIAYIDDSHMVHFGTPQKILPEMSQAPPIIQLGQKYHLSPLPLRAKDFPARLDISAGNRKAKDKPDTQKHPILIELTNLSLALSGRQILDNITLSIQAGEVLTILGPNGAGKTTLLRAMMTLIPAEGKMRLRSQNMKEMKLADLIDTIAFLPQNPNDLLFSETVLEELETTLDNHNLQKSCSELTDFLEKFGLAALKDRFPRDLSVGERQRTALAAVTVHDPQIIFLDEPTRGMDYRTKAALSSLADSWRGQGKAVVLVTHDIEFAATLSDRVVLLEAGQIRFDGSPRTAFTQFAGYQTQIARLFPTSGWITPEEVS